MNTFWRRELPLSGLLAAGFLGLMLTVVSGAPTGPDRWLAGQLQAIPWGGLEFIPRFGSDLGGGAYGFFLVPAVVAAVLAATRQWKALLLLAGVFALHYVLISPKLFIESYRPSPVFGVEGAGGLESFPSGHVEWATSFYGFVAYLLASRFPRYRGAVVAGFGAIVLATMLGRIELGRHWPIDTVAGVMIGLLAVRVLIQAHRLMDRIPVRARGAALTSSAAEPA